MQLSDLSVRRPVLAAVVGGEALRTAAGRAAKAASGEDKRYNAVRRVATRREPNYAQRHGLAAPVDVYPLHENATRAAWDQILAEGQAESADTWTRFSEVEAKKPAAWSRTNE